MNLDCKRIFKDNGIDVYESIDNLMGMEELYDDLLLEFLNDENFEIIKNQLDSGNIRAAFEASHALKGVAGNLGMSRFYRKLHPVVEKLRNDDIADIEPMLETVEEEYRTIKNLIEENIKKEV
ncbi:MAG: Hpt domain-containing protein [Eubacterium sp.]|nr:Hpt domain-containing protein [Eubacterium sp.]